jgi:O-antigen/teichoic acid export membrane protein
MSILRHSIYNLSGAAVPIAVALVTVPIYLHVIGLERYGVLSLCWLIVGYLNFFDFGLGRATAQRIAALHDGEAADRSRAFWAGACLSLVLALLAVIVALPLAPVALETIKTGSPQLASEIHSAIPLLVAAIPVAVAQSSLRGALTGRREFLVANAISSVGAVATATLPLISALVWSPAIAVLVGASLAVRIAVLVAYSAACVRVVPVRRFALPAREHVRSMLRFGAWLTVSNIVSPVMVFVDRFLIGALIGAAAVAIYTIPFNLVSQMLLIPGALGLALFPRLAAAEGSRELTRDAVLETAFLLAPISLIGFLLTEPFLTLWIGPTAASQAAPIAYLLIPGFFANGLAQLPSASLHAAARTDLNAKIHLAEVLPYLACLWLGLTFFGVAGAAIAWSLRVTADFVALSMADRLGFAMLRRVAIQWLLLAALAAAMLSTNLGAGLRWTLVLAISLALLGYLTTTMPDTLVARLRLMLKSEPFKRFRPQ